MIKDKTARNEYHREYMKRKREGLTKGLTEGQGLTSSPTNEGVTGLTDVPDFARVLPLDRIERIRAILEGRARAGLHDDSEGRWMRAVSYLEGEKAR